MCNDFITSSNCEKLESIPACKCDCLALLYVFLTEIEKFNSDCNC